MLKLFIIVLVFIGKISFGESIYYVEPPLEFIDTSIKTALETIFMKAGVPYSIEVVDLRLVTLKLIEKTELDALLNLILHPKGLEFKKDECGVYHIKKGSTDVVPRHRITKLYTLTGSCAPTNDDRREHLVKFDNTKFKTKEEVITKKYAITFTCFQVSHFKKMLSEKGSIKVDIKENSMIVTDIPSVIKKIDKVFKELESPKGKSRNFASIRIPIGCQIFIETPFELNNVQLKSAIETIFKRVRIPYLMRTSEWKILKPVTLKLKERIEVKKLLNLILEPEGLAFKVDKKGVYHITEKYEEKNNDLIKKSYFYEPYYNSNAELRNIIFLIQSVLSSEGKIETVPEYKLLIVKDKPQIINWIDNIFYELD